MLLHFHSLNVKFRSNTCYVLYSDICPSLRRYIYNISEHKFLHGNQYTSGDKSTARRAVSLKITRFSRNFRIVRLFRFICVPRSLCETAPKSYPARIVGGSIQILSLDKSPMAGWAATAAVPPRTERRRSETPPDAQLFHPEGDLCEKAVRGRTLDWLSLSIVRFVVLAKTLLHYGTRDKYRGWTFVRVAEPPPSSPPVEESISCPQKSCLVSVFFVLIIFPAMRITCDRLAMSISSIRVLGYCPVFRVFQILSGYPSMRLSSSKDLILNFSSLAM